MNMEPNLTFPLVSRSIQDHHFVDLELPIRHAKFQDHIGLLVLETKTFKTFCNILAWRPSWSYDLDNLNKLTFPLTKKLHLTGHAFSEKMFENNGHIECTFM